MRFIQNVFKNIFLMILLIPFCAEAESFTGYFTRGMHSIYQQDLRRLKTMQNENAEWFQALDLYSDFWHARLDNFQNKDQLSISLKNGIKQFENSNIGLTNTEKKLITGLFNGMQATIEAENSFYAPLKHTKQALENFNGIAKYCPDEAAFGIGAAHLTAGVFFDNNIIVRSISGFEPSLFMGIKLLNRAALNGVVTKVEALLFLNEYYAGIEENYNRAITYSTLLTKIYPQNCYFNYLHGKNLNRCYRYEQAKVFLNKAAEISDKFYPYQYAALILEAESYFYTSRFEQAKLLNDFAGNILKGLDYYRLHYKILVLSNHSLTRIKGEIPSEYLAKVAVNAEKNLANTLQERKYFEKELAVIKSKSIEDILTVLPSLNNFDDKYRNKIILTMQDFILNLNVSERESRKVIGKLSELFSENNAKAEGLIYRIKLELGYRRFDRAADLFAEISRKYPYFLESNFNHKRLAIWQRMIKNLNGG